MFELTDKMKSSGFSLSSVCESDYPEYFKVKKICYKKYVDEFYGGWDDDVQLVKNKTSFENAFAFTYFSKIMLNDEVVGFLTYCEKADRISNVSLQMIPNAQNNGIGSHFLGCLVDLSDRTGKDIYLKVFKTNPAQNLYKRFDFIVYDETVSHYLMKRIHM